MTPNKRPAALLLLAVVWLSAGCVPAPAYSRDLLLTLTPMSAVAAETVTARALEDSSGSDSLATAVANATEQANGIYATQTARAALYEPARLATASAIAPAVAELPRYGIDPADGYVAWVHDPLTIDLSGYRQSGHGTDFPLVTAADFVLAADVTWTSSSGVGSCGFLFRSDGDADQPSQYAVTMQRTMDARLAFAASSQGEVSNYREFAPKDHDPSFDWTNGSTNRLAVVARGDMIDIYTNGSLVGQVNITQEPPPNSDVTPQPASPSGPPSAETFQQQTQAAQASEQAAAERDQARRNFFIYQPFYYEGFNAFLAANDSGTVSCTFEHAWLFILEP